MVDPPLVQLSARVSRVNMFILVELVELVEWWKKNNYTNRWKDYYPIPDAFGVIIIFEC